MGLKAKIIAVAGKGGVGKTSISATVVKILSETYPDSKILAVDAEKSSLPLLRMVKPAPQSKCWATQDLRFLTHLLKPTNSHLSQWAGQKAQAVTVKSTLTLKKLSPCSRLILTLL